MLSSLWQGVSAFAETAFWFLVVVGILVFLHEAGHFLTAKAFGMRVDVFSFGFGRRLFGRRRGATDYRVSLIPLGGYVRLAGGDEGGAGAEGLPPDYFLARPRWQRLLVMGMGPAVNLALAVGLYAAAFVVGVEMPAPGRPVIEEVQPGSPAAAAGLEPGDRITSIGGTAVEDWDDAFTQLLRSGAREIGIEVERGGVTRSVRLTPAFDERGAPDIGARGSEPAVVTGLVPDMPGAKAGLREGDRIESIDGRAVLGPSSVADVINKSAGRELVLTVRRGAEVLAIRVTPVRARLADGTMGGRIGFLPQPPLEVVRLPPVQALGRATATAWEQAGVLFHVIKNLITRQLPFSMVSGPIEIAKVSRQAARRGVQFVVWMAFISLQLGIMNLLPVPGLDGGHIFLLLGEGLLRRDLSPRLKEVLNFTGIALLIVFMAMVVFQDLGKSLLP